MDPPGDECFGSTLAAVVAGKPHTGTMGSVFATFANSTEAGNHETNLFRFGLLAWAHGMHQEAPLNVAEVSRERRVMNMDSVYQREETVTSDIIVGASNLFGAFTSATIAAVDPTMAAAAGMAGVLTGETVRSILSRMLGSRDRHRVGTVLRHAQERLRHFQAEGETIRQDGFWLARGGIPPAGQEVLEAVLLAAQTEPQERKIPYMGNLFAYIACHSEISDVSAHWLVKTAESLSWTQFELLALVNRIDEVEVEGMSLGEHAPTWDSVALHRELRELGDGEKVLITGKILRTPNARLEHPSTKLADQSLSQSGLLLATALGIEEIQGPRLDDLVDRLRRPVAEEGAQ